MDAELPPRRHRKLISSASAANDTNEGLFIIPYSAVLLFLIHFYSTQCLIYGLCASTKKTSQANFLSVFCE
jgi:hypothetical protein